MPAENDLTPPFDSVQDCRERPRLSDCQDRFAGQHTAPAALPPNYAAPCLVSINGSRSGGLQDRREHRQVLRHSCRVPRRLTHEFFEGGYRCREQPICSRTANQSTGPSFRPALGAPQHARWLRAQVKPLRTQVKIIQARNGRCQKRRGRAHPSHKLQFAESVWLNRPEYI
jgi:hypothetical protein